ncbi:MAG: hypothetical protein FJZ87_17085 [Chloroflexi bacterium]|nr:hypothetical protein [Chloroflexota bacterium]
MVHALGEIHRVLKPHGMLIDIRSIASAWPVEVVTNNKVVKTAWLTDDPSAIEDDLAANRAMSEAESRGWYHKQKADFFNCNYYWDTPSEMLEYLQTEWQGFESLDESTFGRVKSAWASADGDARLRISLTILITRWGKKVGLRKSILTL